MSNELQHHGVKGMKWGVRKAEQVRATYNAPRAVAVKQKPGDYVQSTGGQKQKASADALHLQVSRQKAKASTTDSLSNKELQDLVQRMNLEQQYSRLKKQEDRRTRGQRMVGSIINALMGKDPTINAVRAGLDDSGYSVGDAFAKAASARASKTPGTSPGRPDFSAGATVVKSTVVR